MIRRINAFFSSKLVKRFSSSKYNSRYIKIRENTIPKQSDILIVGGGLIGWSIAFWLRFTSKTTVTLIERDPSYSYTSTLRGYGGLCHQYYCPEYINMSMFSFDFLRNINDYLQVNDDHKIDVNFAPHGHLMLTNDEYSENLIDNFHLQQSFGVSSQYLSKEEISKRWPWINTADIACGSIGLDYEGWFDSAKLLRALQEKSSFLGVNYVIGEVEEIEKLGSYQSFVSPGHFPERCPIQFDPIRYAHIRTATGNKQKISFALLVNSAGCWTDDILEKADSEIKDFPVVKVLQQIFIVRPPDDYSPLSGEISTPSIDAPFIHDTSGLNIQRIGLTGNFAVFSETSDLDIIRPNDEFTMLQNSNHETVEKIYKETIRDQLISRIPCMERAKLVGGWSCLDDYNTYDQYPIIGQHPFQPKMFLACGTNNLDAAHSIAIGRAMSELIFYSMYRTIDLSCFSPHRLLLDLPVGDNKIRS